MARIFTPRNHGSKGSANKIELEALLKVVDSESQQRQQPQPVDADELNEWRRGFTPQAEIWNGRLAMLGLSLGLLTLLLVRIFSM